MSRSRFFRAGKEQTMNLESLCREVSRQMRPLRGQSVLIALSGGADSVALACVLCRLRASEGWRLRAGHVNHGLRGAESDGDEAFVKALCRRLALPLACRRLTPPDHAGETWAREARYGALLSMAAEADCEVVALAHHRDDQAETLLEHLLRGCGPGGMAGMRPISAMGGATLARPLLEVSRQAIRSALEDAGETWREDGTNTQTFCLRNRLRLEILPALEAVAPGAAERLASAARLQAGEQAMLEEMEQAFLRRYDRGWRALPLQALQALHPAMRARVLRRWWRELAPDAPRLDGRQTAAWMETAAGARGARCNLPADWHGERGYGFLHGVPPGEAALAAVALRPAAGVYALGRVALRVSPWRAEDGTGDGKRWQAVPGEALQGCVLRTRRTGDWMRPFGGGGSKSVQDVLTDRKVDAAFRHRVPMVCKGTEALLIAGVAAGNLPCIDETKDLWTLRWDGYLPWLDD